MDIEGCHSILFVTLVDIEGWHSILFVILVAFDVDWSVKSQSSDKTGGQAEGWSGLFRLRALPGNRWTIIECIFLAGNDI